MANIQQSTKAYEDWLRAQLGGEVVDKDQERKHEKMRDNQFAFLRAIYGVGRKRSSRFVRSC